MTSEKVKVIQYLVDTRNLWPAATETKQLENEASRALSLLTSEERTSVLRYYFVADAKMSLASQLLKHWVVSRYCSVPWWDTKLSRDVNKKPIYVNPATGKEPVSFNVSHQAGLVALVATHGYRDGKSDVGTDVVCTSERRKRDHAYIRSEGWPAFVDMHADVFGRGETEYLKTGLRAPPGDEAAMMDFKLRAFYTLWCLREAYVKMTGDALLASWLPDLNFRNFKAPARASGFTQKDGGEETIINKFDILFEGRTVDDVNISLRTLGPDYITCTALRTPQKKEDGLRWELGPYEFLGMDEILSHAESAAGS